MELDVDHLIDLVTNEIIRRLGESEKDRILVTDGCPADAVSENYEAVTGNDPGVCKYVLLTETAYRSLVAGAAVPGRCEESAACGGSVDVRGKHLLHERDLRNHNVHRDTVILVSKKTIITALALDYAKSLGAKIVREN